METELSRIEEQISEITKKIEDPKLGSGTAETMTRVSGYYRAVSGFNDGKGRMGEFGQRKEYSVSA